MTSLLNRMALLVHMALDRPAPERRSVCANVVLGSRTPPLPPPPYGILEGEEGIDRAMGGDMEPCRLWRVPRLDDDKVWTGL